MATHPVTRNIDGQNPISRAGTSRDIETYLPVVYNSVAEMQTDDLTGVRLVAITDDDGGLTEFSFDSDSVAAHDGTTVLVDLVGNRFVRTDFVAGTGIRSIVALTQAAYDALGTPDAETLYVIVG